MNDIPQVQALVMFDGEQLVTDSRVLASTFNRAHKTVLRAYDNLKCSTDFSQHNFVPTEYVDEQGKTCRSVTMTKDGFTMLATFPFVQVAGTR